MIRRWKWAFLGLDVLEHYNQVVRHQLVMVGPDWDQPRATFSVLQRPPSCWTGN